jgi:protein-S-isoprenylcysteine O-methyltransferase Ste14
MNLRRTGVLMYGVFCYLLHWLITLYLIGFMGNIWWRKTIDVEITPVATLVALAVDLCVVALFIFLHWLMARPWFKRKWSCWMPPPIERSTYVLVTCLALAGVFWLWQPLNGSVWLAAGEPGYRFLTATYFAGWTLAIVATFPINHWELFGIRQAWLYWSGRDYTPPQVRKSILYRLLPHPIFVGYAVALWAAPRMGWGHFLFSAILSMFLLIDLRLAAAEG